MKSFYFDQENKKKSVFIWVLFILNTRIETCLERQLTPKVMKQNLIRKYKETINYSHTIITIYSN